MTLKKACGLISYPSQILDHTAPLCGLLNIPLITDDLKTKLIADRFYPKVDVKLRNWNAPYLWRNFDILFYCFRIEPLFTDTIKRAKKLQPDNPLWDKDVKLIYGMHGCSDKGFHSDGFKTCVSKETDLVLIYGQRTLDIFHYKENLKDPDSYVFSGNYRREYYLKHKEIYTNYIQNQLFSYFKEKKPTILYAPTWEDRESNSSLQKACIEVLENLPKDFNLVFKVHPYMIGHRYKYNPEPFIAFLNKYVQHPNIMLLTDFCLIYPLLNACDIYLGDASSIGYDFLSFNKPMFFLNPKKLDSKTDPATYLYRCGIEILPKDFPNIYPIIKSNVQYDYQNFSSTREKVYKYAFGKKDDKFLLKDVLQKKLNIKFHG